MMQKGWRFMGYEHDDLYQCRDYHFVRSLSLYTLLGVGNSCCHLVVVGFLLCSYDCI